MDAIGRRATALIVHDFPVIRYGLRSLLRARGQVDGSAEAGSIAEAKTLLSERAFDMVISELWLPDGSIIEAVEQTRWSGKLLAFSRRDGWRDVETFLGAGGLGFLSYRSPLSEVFAAVDAVEDGRVWISPSVRAAHSNFWGEGPQIAGVSLTAREREIAALVVTGLTSKQIAAQLCLSEKTVENHRHRIHSKLGIRNSAQLAQYAVTHGL